MFAYELQLDTTWKNHRIKTRLMQSSNPNYKFKHIWPKKNFTPRNPVGTLLSSLSSFEWREIRFFFFLYKEPETGEISFQSHSGNSTLRCFSVWLHSVLFETTMKRFKQLSVFICLLFFINNALTAEIPEKRKQGCSRKTRED